MNIKRKNLTGNDCQESRWVKGAANGSSALEMKSLLKSVDLDLNLLGLGVFLKLLRLLPQSVQIDWYELFTP